MKKTEQSIVELSQTKSLLEKIEGGQRGTNLKAYLPGAIDLPRIPCDFLQCVTPMYGAVTDPRWTLKD